MYLCTYSSLEESKHVVLSHVNRGCTKKPIKSVIPHNEQNKINALHRHFDELLPQTAYKGVIIYFSNQKCN